MKYKVYAKPGTLRARMFADCGGNKKAAEELAKRLAKDDFYSRVKIIETPAISEMKPYKRKETIYKP